MSLYVKAVKHLREITLDVELTFEPGPTLLVGPSGAGKTTLLRLSAGLDALDSGRVALGDELLDDGNGRFVPARKRDIAFVFQEYALFPHLSVAENVAYGLVARGVPRDERRARVAAALERFEIAATARARPDRLSGGQRQRVALARALVLEPRVLLLDEPLAALDIRTRSAVRDELRTVVAGLSTPTLLVTHDAADARTFPERLVIVEDGSVTQVGSFDVLGRWPASAFVAEFAGASPSANRSSP
jgi:molybdate transport system ATP-binding protein